MRLLGLQHVSITVTDKEKSRDFYRDVLGMREIPHPDRFSTVTWLEAAGTEIHLIPADERHKGPSIPLSDVAVADGEDTHVAFAVASLPAAIAHLEQLQVPLACGPRPRGDGPHQLYVRDPDGYLIELFAWG